MRASDVMGARVVREDGRRLGFVTGLRCTLDGPSSGAVPAPRLQELVVTRRRTGAWLGYQQETQRGPWLIRVALTALHPRTQVIAWSEVVDLSPGRVTLGGSSGG
jgi:hypothetical protein